MASPKAKTKPIKPSERWPADKIERRAVTDLTVYPDNPRLHSDAQVAEIAASMREWGWTVPVLIDEDNGIIAGHGRVTAAEKLGITEVPVVVARGWSAAQKRAYVIADNQIPQNSTWDQTLLRVNLTQLAKVDYPLHLTGFDNIRLATFGVGPTAPQADADEEQVVQSAAVSRLGDLWVLGNHLLLAADCCDQKSVKKVMDGKVARLCNTDPPYGIDYSKTKNGIPGSGFKNHTETWGNIENDELTEGAALQEFLERAIKVAASAACAPDAAWYFWHPMLTQGTFFAAAAAAAILIHRQIIWVKPGFVLTRSGQYHWKHELCFYGWIKGNPAPWFGDKSQTSVWEVGRDGDSGQHPTQKPVDLFVRPINNHTREGESIYEPFCGSGSQIIAAEMTGRICHAIEIEPRYVDVAVRRWQAFTGRKATLHGTKKTFDQIVKERSKIAA